MVNNNIRKTMQSGGLAGLFLNALLTKPMQWRMQSKIFFFPWEVWLARVTDRVVSRRSLLTGVPLPENTQEVC
jgi:hypothetical protein